MFRTQRAASLCETPPPATSHRVIKRAPQSVGSGQARLDAPPAAGRAWVPGCRARTHGPYTLSTPHLPSWQGLVRKNGDCAPRGGGIGRPGGPSDVSHHSGLTVTSTHSRNRSRTVMVSFWLRLSENLCRSGTLPLPSRCTRRASGRGRGVAAVHPETLDRSGQTRKNVTLRTSLRLDGTLDGRAAYVVSA